MRRLCPCTLALASALAAACCASPIAEGALPPPPGGNAPFDRPPVPGTRQVLRGSIDPSGSATFAFWVGRDRGQRLRVYDWKLTGVPVRCGDRHAVAKVPVTGGEAIWNRYARDGLLGRETDIDGDPHHPEYATTVSGRVLRPKKPWGRRHSAKGIVRVWGSAVPLRGGGSAACDSGRLHWTATNGAARGW